MAKKLKKPDNWHLMSLKEKEDFLVKQLSDMNNSLKMKNLSTLQIQIIELLKKDNDFMTCDDIAWELKKHKIHIGNSVKALVKRGILDSYRSQWDKYGNIKYFVVD